MDQTTVLDQTGPDQTARDQTRTGPDRTAGRITAPVLIAMALIAMVWLAGAIWSFEEQTAYAASSRFAVPQLLPLVIDGFAVAMAAVAWSASLDGRTAVLARLATGLAIAGSAASNAAWAWQRSGRVDTIALAAAVPIVAMAAFEVLLGEVRGKIRARRGLLPPVPVPAPRLVRILLAPWDLLVWRRQVLAATDQTVIFAAVRTGPEAAGRVDQAGPDQTRLVHSQAEPGPEVDGNDDRTGPDRPDADRAGLDREAGDVVRIGRITLEARVAELDRRWPDQIPSRRVVMEQTGWRSSSATAAAIAEAGRRRGGPTRRAQ